MNQTWWQTFFTVIVVPLHTCFYTMLLNSAVLQANLRFRI